MIDSDGTVIIYFGRPFPSGGTEQTIVFCIKQKKPYLLIDAEELTIERASKKIEKFIAQNNISVLNVAGPGGDGVPRAYEYDKKVILNVCCK